MVDWGHKLFLVLLFSIFICIWLCLHITRKSACLIYNKKSFGELKWNTYLSVIETAGLISKQKWIISWSWLRMFESCVCGSKYRKHAIISLRFILRVGYDGGCTVHTTFLKRQRLLGTYELEWAFLWHSRDF